LRDVAVEIELGPCAPPSHPEADQRASGDEESERVELECLDARDRLDGPDLVEGKGGWYRVQRGLLYQLEPPEEVPPKLEPPDEEPPKLEPPDEVPPKLEPADELDDENELPPENELELDENEDELEKEELDES